MTSSDGLPLSQGDLVHHERYGVGAVVANMGETAVVRFDQRIEECATSDLELLPPLIRRMGAAEWDVPLEVINRVQAEAITSVNSAWGVFARSRIELLPHQLWVCRKVNDSWPMHWLVAEDVGLGKTIEAGIILTPLIASGTVRRVLILSPASLVEQWQFRLRTMFDIRLAVYSGAADTPRTAFWETHNQVIASLQTLRLDRHGRAQRVLEAEPFDLLMVDEAHHLNADEQHGATLGYQLVRRLVEAGKVRSMVFFTGTPHRGKDFGFLALLQLLRPDLFDAKRNLREQLSGLKQVMIRNNKYNVTDIEGKRLFREPEVCSETYSYSDQEQRFYEMLSDFILRGKAYASTLPQNDGRTAMLVLIAMQKLASSSVAAIRRALRGRLARIHGGRQRLTELQSLAQQYRELEDMGLGDRLAEIEEEIAESSSQLRLMEDEEAALEQLLSVAESIHGETKIERILEVIDTRFRDASVLFFTEYKATQSLLMSALLRRFGAHCVTFINGDEQATDVCVPNGDTVTLMKPREEAAAEFNRGRVRFLVSTEAGGEGIDLQESCHTLVHVDLPWNPMRLHQRVGRLNRYGQTERVTVLTMRNPDTVESRIWVRLNEKLDRINRAFLEVMDEPEDMLHLVLGMTSPALFRGLFADAPSATDDKLTEWFDQRTATFGGRDAVDTVRALVGNVSRFDFRQVSARIPKVDLPDLRHFLEGALVLNGRRVVSEGDRLSFKTPDGWRDDPAVRQRYSSMSFDRTNRSADATSRLLGVGHRVVDKALGEAKQRRASVASVPHDALPRPIVVFRLNDRVTDGPRKSGVVAGVELREDGTDGRYLLDWELLKRLNAVPLRREAMRTASRKALMPGSADVVLAAASEVVQRNIGALDLGFRVPHWEPIAMLWPAASK
ncbi:DEAD/DEAH box helicase [Planctomycetota bacterium]